MTRMSLWPLRKVLRDLLAERERQDRLWGEQNHSDLEWQSILLEEIGEVARCLNADIAPVTKREHDLGEELTQCAAVLVAWLECRQRRRNAL